MLRSSIARRALAFGTGPAVIREPSPADGFGRRYPHSRGPLRTCAAPGRVSRSEVRFINVVDLFELQPSTEHPHGLTDVDYDSWFTPDKPIVFNFHGYPWLIHRLTYGRTNKALHVRCYKVVWTLVV